MCFGHKALGGGRAVAWLAPIAPGCTLQLSHASGSPLRPPGRSCRGGAARPEASDSTMLSVASLLSELSMCAVDVRREGIDRGALGAPRAVDPPGVRGRSLRARQ